MCNCIFCLTSGGAMCCTVWSGMSVIFLVFVGVVLGTPPVYVKEITEDQAANASYNAYVVAAMYAATTLVAFFMYSVRARQEKSQLGKEAATSPVRSEASFGDSADAFSAPLVEGGASSASLEGGRASSASAGKKKRAAKVNKAESSSKVTTI